MTTLTPAEIQRGLFENDNAPNGAARNARAEELSAAAERTGDRALLRRSLSSLIDAYEYSSERTKMLVPFARLLQEYDTDAAAFDGYETHRLFWHFKWVTSNVVSSPDIPLDVVERWLADMERRYRVAGFSARAVRKAEFYLADTVGDAARADRAIAGWADTERDRMSDCLACEINTQGGYWSRKGEDAKAIEVWQPVLSGNDTCLEEPHRVLAHSLLPLMRLGRPADARSHHLRGYRMARGNESLLREIGEHIEFCALTGNESRGLEILSEHTAHLGPLTDLESQLEFNGGILVLLRRLTDLGHGDRPAVPYRGTARTVSELYDQLYADATAIVDRFDARNGTAHMSSRLTERLARQPLVDFLPLGVRSPVLAAPARTAAEAGRGPDTPTGADTDTDDIAELAARARSLREQGHPGADSQWERVAARLEAAGQTPDPLLAADLLEHRALRAARAGAQDARELFAESLAAHRAIGQDGRAALAELRLATAAAQSGAEAAEIRELLATALGSAEALADTDPSRARRVAAAEINGIRIEAFLRAGEADHDHDGVDGRLERELTAFVAARESAEGLGHLVAEAELMLAEFALRSGDEERAESLFGSAAERNIAAGQPGEAAQPLARRAGLLFARGGVEEAEAAARAAVEQSTELTDPEEQAIVRLTLADILVRRGGRQAEAADHALDAAHWFDQAGLGAAGGAQARLVLAKAYAAAERTAEAAEVLQSALPDLLGHGEYRGVHARETLGDLLGQLRDARGAAEQYLLAADTAKGWDDPAPQAHFAQLAAESLSRAGLPDEARSAYRRALQLWRESGDNPVAEVRILRSLAWLAGYRNEEDFDAARDLMHQALAVLDGADDDQSRYERGQTWHQLANLTMSRLPDDEYDDFDDDDDDDDEQDKPEPAPDAVDEKAVRLEAIRLWEQAADAYATLGLDALEERARCLTGAAWSEHAMGRADEATARLTTLAAELRTQDDTRARRTVSQLEDTLRHLA
ncbi:tetratricopeptide repeat protein [Streptomyces sp. AcH 505]|uniref:tetratricopeptide repeat protein n=1 Tax=Streptomyces sp. AcH 505 TaxID=352211 RepID=UPI00069343E5